MQNNNKPLWGQLIMLSFFAYMYGLIWASETKFAGIHIYLWVIWAAFGMLFSGLTLGLLQRLAPKPKIAGLQARLLIIVAVCIILQGIVAAVGWYLDASPETDNAFRIMGGFFGLLVGVSATPIFFGKPVVKSIDRSQHGGLRRANRNDDTDYSGIGAAGSVAEPGFINPATGLMMTGGLGGIDAGGFVFGQSGSFTEANAYDASHVDGGMNFASNDSFTDHSSTDFHNS
jgi:hypothetical protein